MISLAVKQWICLAVLLVVAGCQPMAAYPVPQQANQLLVFGGPILTMDAPAAEAMLVEDGTIRALGDFSELVALAPAATRLDLAGRTLMPGFIDSHVHVRELGMDAIKADKSPFIKLYEENQRLIEANKKLIEQAKKEGKF